MSVFGLDYAWGSMSVAALRTAGAEYVCRYLSHDAGKNLTPGEAVTLSEAGIWIVAVWETTARRAMSGKTGGIDDAREALRQATLCGMPPDRPIYFAVDWDASVDEQPTINAYMAGAGTVLGPERVGMYGGYGPVSRAFTAGVITWGWQTYAWSAGRWHTAAQLRQYSNDHLVGGVGVDYNIARKADFGQWRVGASPSSSSITEDDMPSGLLADGTQAVTPISLPRGRYKTIGFIADNGLQGLPPAVLRVAIHAAAGWSVETKVTVDSAKGQTVITFPSPSGTDGISVRREDGGAVHVAYQVS